MREVSKKIGDPFIKDLLIKYLKAGFFLGGKYHKGTIGLPQGGLISPILANIVLDLFDKYMEGYISKFNKGKFRKRNNLYAKYRINLSKSESVEDKRK